MSTKQPIDVTPRTVYPRNGRKRTVYDANGVTEDGIEYGIDGAATASDARKQAQAQVDFCRANPPVKINGFRLFAQNVEWFGLSMPGGCCSMFAARSRDAALARIVCDYTERADVVEFVRDALALESDRA